MKIAVISDIHGNKYALQAVLEDIRSRSVDTIVSTGDLVGYLPFPCEVIDELREQKIMVLKGNHDQRISEMRKLAPDEFDSISIDEKIKSGSAMYIRQKLRDEHIDYLTGLPTQIELEFEKFKILFVHGSPRDISEYMYENSNVLDEIEALKLADVIVSGHTHIPYHKIVNETHFINAGSVGKPKHGNSNAMYLILEVRDNAINATDNTEGYSLKADFIEVGYDLKAFSEEIIMDSFISDGLITSLQKGK